MHRPLRERLTAEPWAPTPEPCPGVCADLALNSRFTRLGPTCHSHLDAYMASPPSPNGILALPYQTHPRHSLSISDFGNSISPSAAPPSAGTKNCDIIPTPLLLPVSSPSDSSSAGGLLVPPDQGTVTPARSRLRSLRPTLSSAARDRGHLCVQHTRGRRPRVPRRAPAPLLSAPRRCRRTPRGASSPRAHRACFLASTVSLQHHTMPSHPAPLPDPCYPLSLFFLAGLYRRTLCLVY